MIWFFWRIDLFIKYMENADWYKIIKIVIDFFYELSIFNLISNPHIQLIVNFLLKIIWLHKEIFFSRDSMLTFFSIELSGQAKALYLKSFIIKGNDLNFGWLIFAFGLFCQIIFLSQRKDHILFITSPIQA